MVVSSSSLRAYRSSGKAIPSAPPPSAPMVASGWPWFYPFARQQVFSLHLLRQKLSVRALVSSSWVDNLHRFDVDCHVQDQRSLDCGIRTPVPDLPSLTIGWLGGVGTGTFTTWIQIGGWLGIVTAIAAWYTALAGVLASLKFINLPTMPMNRS